ncbi:hypothetical protein PoB_005771800 [Plakobranchus ocellatus]|uniref:Uncharacterized protein n=1 Tax=Plakobranchus ocellatus TaxID=259542 RepID=A0AAV4CJF4_9GAST|nr:hypothetical protein PoB_005771800 [Plakobranchus ocellatus]
MGEAADMDKLFDDVYEFMDTIGNIMYLFASVGPRDSVASRMTLFTLLRSFLIIKKSLSGTEFSDLENARKVT